MPTLTATYTRPVAASLHVHLDNGEVFEATDDDLAKFGYVSRHQAYMTFRNALEKALHEAGALPPGRDLTDAHLNPLRYLAELAITHPSLLEHPETASLYADLVRIEKALDFVHTNSGSAQPASGDA